MPLFYCFQGHICNISTQSIAPGCAGRELHCQSWLASPLRRQKDSSGEQFQGDGAHCLARHRHPVPGTRRSAPEHGTPIRSRSRIAASAPGGPRNPPAAPTCSTSLQVGVSACMWQRSPAAKGRAVPCVCAIRVALLWAERRWVQPTSYIEGKAKAVHNQPT